MGPESVSGVQQLFADKFFRQRVVSAEVFVVAPENQVLEHTQKEANRQGFTPSLEDFHR